MRVILVGNYGAGNIGDEALREYFLSAFPDLEWSVVSASPIGLNELPRLPFGVRSFFSNWVRTISAIKHADALVFGGGTLFTDTESVFASIMWWTYAATARFFGTPYCLAFQGVGPFHSGIARLFTRSVYEHAAFVSVRDEVSLQRIGEWKIKSEPVLTFDPAFLRFSNFAAAEMQRLGPKPGVSAAEHKKGKVLVIIPRWNSTESFYEAIPTYAAEQWDAVRILMLEPSAKEEQVARDLQALFKNAVIVPVGSVSELLEEIAQASLVLTQRYHGAIAAAALNIPFETFSQRKGDKLEALSGILAKKLELFSRLTLGQEALDQCLRKCIRLSGA